MPSAESVIDRAFVELLGKARRRADAELRRQVPREATINIVFSGGGLALPPTGLAGLVEVPYACIPVWAHIYAGDDFGTPVAVTATVDLQVTNITAYPGGTPMNGTGSPPSLTAQTHHNVDISFWISSLLAADAIIYRLSSFTGTATWLAVNIGIRALDSDQVVSIVDSAGDFVVDENGNIVVLRG